MIPKHENPKRPERTATAPYNFVPLPDRVIAFPDRPDTATRVDQGIYHKQQQRLTGWIDVDLETLSPVYIRAGLTPEQYEKMERQEKDPDDRTPHLKKERNRPEFYYRDDPNKPVIPGSSLRGMLRTMCEIIGHGKLTPVSDQALVYRAVGDISSHGVAYRQELMDELRGEKNYFVPKFDGGYIREEPDGWYIQPAERLNPSDPDSPTYARIKIDDIPQSGLKRWRAGRQTFEIHVECDRFEFKKVRGGFVHIKRVNVKRVSASPGPGLRLGVLAKTGPVPKKATEAVIFAPANVPKTEWIRIPDGTDHEDKRDLVTEYLDQVTKTGKHNQKELLGSDQGVLRDGHPVMYVMQGDKLLRFFGHTQMFRMPYRRSPRAFLPADHEKTGTVDLAQLMFGTARSQTSGAAGRVFVEDAVCLEKEGTNLWLEKDPVVIPKILSGPKPTTFQHYLVQPQPDIDKGKGLKTYNDIGQTTLRGHKLYWHKGNPDRASFAERPMSEDKKQKDTQHTQMKPVRAGVNFRFRVRFENLLPEELGLLWWSLKLLDNGDYAHKIGMGKPLGLGSVRLTPTLTLIDPEARYSSLLISAGTEFSKGVETEKVTDDFKNQAVAKFEQLVIRGLRLPEGTSLAETPRMLQLLEMLRWPGPPPEKTRYMDIGIDEETNKLTGKNEFKERPVLPDPMGVVHKR